MQQYAKHRHRSRSRAAEVPAAADAWHQTTPLGRVISAGRAFVQNFHRGHHDIATQIQPSPQLPVAFAEVALAI
jgi:hypothetical protein